MCLCMLARSFSRMSVACACEFQEIVVDAGHLLAEGGSMGYGRVAVAEGVKSAVDVVHVDVVLLVVET